MNHARPRMVSFGAVFVHIVAHKGKACGNASHRGQATLMENIPQNQIKTVRMAEIAQRLGVASSTISRALRNDPRISLEVRKRVRSVAEELGYQPNPLVSALMANRRRRGSGGAVDVIALVTNYGGRKDWRTKDVCRWEYEGIQRRASELGFRVEIFALADYRGEMPKLQATLRARAIRGVLLGFSREEKTETPFSIVRTFPVAGLSGYFPEVVADRANFHGFFNVQLALDQMHRHGYRRPTLIAPALNNRISNNLWSAAFLDWQRRLAKKTAASRLLSRAKMSIWRSLATGSIAMSPIRFSFTNFRCASFWRDEVSACRKISVWRICTGRPTKWGMPPASTGISMPSGPRPFDLVVERLHANATGASKTSKGVF